MMLERTTFPPGMYLTQYQWAKKMMAVNADAQGTEMWCNHYHQRTAIYFTEAEVHPATAAEIAMVFAPAREKRKEYNQRYSQRRIAREKEIEEQAKLFGEARATEKILSLIAGKLPTAPSSSKSRSVTEKILQNKAIIFDTETTGLSDTDELLQISIIDNNGTVLMDTMVRPYFHSSWVEAQRINGISPEDVEKAPYLHEILPELCAIFAKAKVCIGYNVKFDLAYINRAGVSTDHLNIIDVMLEFSSYYAEKNQQTKPRRHKLTACADHFGFKWSGDAHNALHDAQATLFCYQSIRNGKE